MFPETENSCLEMMVSVEDMQGLDRGEVLK